LIFATVANESQLVYNVLINSMVLLEDLGNQNADANHTTSFCKTLFKIKIHGNKKSKIYS